jgi:hypothetical protein
MVFDILGGSALPAILVAIDAVDIRERREIASAPRR